MMALPMESESNLDTSRASSALIRPVLMLFGWLLEVLAPFRNETAKTCISISMFLAASTLVSVVTLIGAVFTTHVTKKTVSLATEKTWKCCILSNRPMLLQHQQWHSVTTFPLHCHMSQ